MENLNKEYYNKIKVHQGIDKSEDSDKEVEENFLKKTSNITSKLFIIKGKPYFSDLNLREYGWKIAHALTPQQKKFLESTPGYLDYKETIFYKGPQGNAVLHANYKKDIHKLRINFNSSQDENSDTIKAVKWMFEREWECRLEDKEEASNLVKEVKSN